MILCRAIVDKQDIQAWTRTGPNAGKLYEGFEPQLNDVGKFEVSVNRCETYSDFLLATMAVRAIHATGYSNTPIMVAVSIDDTLLEQHGIQKKYTKENGNTGFAEIDRLHFDLLADSKDSFKSLAKALYFSHLKAGNTIHTLNNGCILRGCNSLLSLANSPDPEAARRITEGVKWLKSKSDMLDNVGSCERPALWDLDDPESENSGMTSSDRESAGSSHKKFGWFRQLFSR